MLSLYNHLSDLFDIYIKFYIFLNNNINELVHFSMLETNEYLKENMLFGGGTSLYIKVGLLNLSINGSVNAEIKDFCDNFISNIKNIIIN